MLKINKRPARNVDGACTRGKCLTPTSSIRPNLAVPIASMIEGASV